MLVALEKDGHPHWAAAGAVDLIGEAAFRADMERMQAEHDRLVAELAGMEAIAGAGVLDEAVAAQLMVA